MLFPEIGRVKFFYHSPARIVECVSNYIFLISGKKRQKALETKEEKITSAENLAGYDDIVCEFALCTFNLLD